MAAGFVERLALSHLRSWHRFEGRFTGRPVAIFGPNGAGKTNLLEAVSLLSPGRGLRGATAAAIARRPDAIGWKVRATLTRGGERHEVETGVAAGNRRDVLIDDAPATQPALGRLLPMIWLVPAMDRLWTEAPEGRRRFLDRIALSFAPEHAGAALAYDRALRERNRLLRDEVRDWAWYDAIEDQMAKAGAALMRGRIDALAAVRAAQTDAVDFPKAHVTLIDPDGRAPLTAAHELSDAFRDGRGRDLAAGRTLTGPQRIDLDARHMAKDVPAREASTGEQKALLLSLVLANARALGEREAMPIVLLDEVGAHLDADRRAALFERVRTLGLQAWMTGTSADIFEGLGPADRLSVREDGGASLVRFHDDP